MTAVMIAVLFVGTFVALLVVWRSDSPEASAVAILLGASTLVPMVSVPPELAMAFAISAAMVAVVARSRRKRPYVLNRNAPVWFATALLVYMQLARMLGGQAFVQEWSLVAVALTIVWLSSGLRAGDLLLLARILNVFLAFHLLYAFAELFSGAVPVWPMGDGTFDLKYRPNFLLTWLPGRAMTSFAHPIPLATFAVAVGLLDVHLALTHRKRLFYGACASVLLILLSGTRSAVIALVGGLVVVLVSNRRITTGPKALLAFFGLGLAVLTAFSPGSVLGSIGLGEGFADSNSYQYRSSILKSAGGILRQTLPHVLFGWGGDRSVIFERGIVDGADYGVTFFDNQFVAMAALFGLVGFGMFLMSFVWVAVRGGELARALLVAFAAMGFGFDFLQYMTPALLFYFAVVIGGVRQGSTGPPIGSSGGNVALSTRST